MNVRLPAISVVLPVHNAEKTVSQAVHSILNQTFRDFELLAIDDGSTDGSAAILETVAKTDGRLKVIQQINSGLVPTLNAAIELTRGEFIARMDADDISAPHRFETQLKFLKRNSRLGGVSSFYREIDGSDRELWKCQMPVGTDVIRNHLRSNGNALVHPVMMLRREAIIKCGGYRELFKHAEDYDLWLRIVERYDLDNIPEYLIDYRRSDCSVSARYREEQLLASIAARRSALLRLRGHPDPADTASVISREVLHAWGVDDTEIRRLMLEWLAWHRRMLIAVGATPAPELAHLERQYAAPVRRYIIPRKIASPPIAFSVGVIVTDRGRDLEKTLISALRSSLVRDIFVYAPELDDNARKKLSQITAESVGRISSTIGGYISQWSLGRYLTAVVEESSADYLSVLRSGDIAISGRYSEAANLLAALPCELVFGECVTVKQIPYKRGVRVKIERTLDSDLPENLSTEEIDPVTLLLSNPELGMISNLLFSKALYYRLHGMADFTFTGDLDFALRAALFGAAKFSNRPFTAQANAQEYSRYEHLIKAAEIRQMAARSIVECKGLSTSAAVRDRLRHLSGEAA